MKVAVVIAAYDEIANIEALTRRLDRALAAIPADATSGPSEPGENGAHANCWEPRDAGERELIFVVEGHDGTREALAQLAREIPGIRILYQPERAGLGAAFRRGFAAVAADAEFVVTMDADLNHQPEEIPRLLAAAQARGCDVLVGSRCVRASRVDGIPLWKRAFSRILNALMRRLFRLDVEDKTSGFRIYRAAALRGLHFENDDFSFLPELLILAGNQGSAIAEEPIHFRYRTAGRSKMAFWNTSLSYLALLRTGLDRTAWLTALLLFIGVLLRVLAAYPSHKYAADGDAALNGLCAYKILHGDHPVFFSGVRLGSIGAHLTALLFLLFGTSRDSLAAGPLILGILTLFIWCLLLRELLGRKLALIGLPFAAVLPPAVGFWTYQPNGYAETLLLCAAILWLAARNARGNASRWSLFALGLSAGLGWWQSLLTLGCTVPALLWLHWRRPELWRRRGAALAVAAGLLAGASPWIEFNVHHPWGSFRANYAVRPAGGLDAVLDNARHLIAYDLPELVASTDPENLPRPVPKFLLGLRWLTLALCLAAAAYLTVSQAPAAWRARRPRDGSAAADPTAAWVLLALVAAAVSILLVLSEPGLQRRLSVRFVLPLYLLAPGMLAIFLARVSRRWAVLPWLLGGGVLAFYLAGATLPGTALRQSWASGKKSDEQLIAFLRREHIDAVAGSYWNVYPVTFLTAQRVQALAVDADPNHLADQLGSRPLRWALIAERSFGLLLWAQGAHVTGRLARVNDSYYVFLPLPNPPLDPLPAFVQRLVNAATPRVDAWLL